VIKFSVFTPTNDTTWINDCYISLKKQTYTNWEWIIVPNGDTPLSIPQDIATDPRVLLKPVKSAKIGALKSYACSHATGDIYVELDHDDILVDTALQRMFDRHMAEGPGFHYSDFASYYPNGSPEVYNNLYGWKTYDYTYEGKQYVAHKCFPDSPSSLGQIYYAPNHVRAWHRDVYYQAGGHDVAMEVCDDHDLVCKTYLTGAKFYYHEECLYLYRRILDPKKSNSFVAKADKIAKGQNNNYNRYLHKLCEEWCKRGNLPMINLGGGSPSPKGYKSLDVREADIIHKIGESPLPFDNNSVGIIRAFDVLTHIPRDKFVACMNDFYRVLAPGGFILSGTPSSDGRGAVQDPTHINYINQNAFWYDTDRNYSKYVPEVDCRFQAARLWTVAPSDFHKNNNILYVYADLCALKGQHQPGPCKI